MTDRISVQSGKDCCGVASVLTVQDESQFKICLQSAQHEGDGALHQLISEGRPVVAMIRNRSVLLKNNDCIFNKDPARDSIF